MRSHSNPERVCVYLYRIQFKEKDEACLHSDFKFISSYTSTINNISLIFKHLINHKFPFYSILSKNIVKIFNFEFKILIFILF